MKHLSVGRFVALGFAFAVLAATRSYAGVIYMDENFEGAQVFQNRYWALTGQSQEPTSATLPQGINLRRWDTKAENSCPTVEIGAQEGAVVSTRAFGGAKSYRLTGGQTLAMQGEYCTFAGSRCWQFALSTDANSVAKPKGTFLGQFEAEFDPSTSITLRLEATGAGKADLVSVNAGKKMGELTGATDDWLLVTVIAMNRVNPGIRSDTVTQWITYDPLTKAFKGPEPGLPTGIHLFTVNKASGARSRIWLKRGRELPEAWGSDGAATKVETGWSFRSAPGGTMFIDNLYWDARNPEGMESGFDHERAARIEPFPVGLTMGFLFTDNAVFQRDQPIPVYGISVPGDPITAKFRGQTRKVTADNAGRWRVTFDATGAGGPFDLAVTGETSITIHNIMVGEVWVCSGQSNMALTMKNVDNATSEIAAANHPSVRYLNVFAAGASRDVDYQSGNWQVCTSRTVPNCTAAGYYFGLDIYNGLGGTVPVGIINSSYGATRAELWASAPSQLASGIPPSHLKPIWMGLGDLYKGMIHPLLSYPIRGANWYQGESNADTDTAADYGVLLATLIKDWRSHWNLGDFPFQVVQLPNYQDTGTTGTSWPVVRDGQLQALRVWNTALAVTIDTADPHSLHPGNKKPVGHRLALPALAKVYGKRLAYSGPIFRGATPEADGWLRLTFDYASGGLVDSNGGTLDGFEVAGSNGVFYPAEASIDGETVRIHSASVASPQYARYAWADNPPAQLFNTSLLPASPFRWELKTGVKNSMLYR